MDKNGNVYTTGKEYGSIFVQKQDNNGNVKWLFRLGGRQSFGKNITLDDWGNIYIAGYFRGKVDFDPGPGTFYLESHPGGYYGPYDGFVLKLDSGGNFIWAVQFAQVNPHHSDFYTLDVAVDPSGNVFVGGTFKGTVDLDPGPGTYLCQSGGFIVKLDMNFNFVWAYAYYGTCGSKTVRAVEIDGSGNVVIAGANSRELDMDPGPGECKISGGYLAKLTNDGDFIWASPTSPLIVYDFVLDGSDNVYAITNRSFTKFSANGDFLWSSYMDGIAVGNSIALDKSGNIYCTGYFKDTVDFDPGPGTFELTSAGLYDIFVMQLDNTGNLGWAVSMGGSEYDYGSGIAVDGSSNFFVTGWFHGTADFDPGEGTLNLTSWGGVNADIFVLKMIGVTNEPPVAICLEDVTVEVDENCQASITAADVDGGSYDPDEGDEITLSLDNSGPFGIGIHNVELTVTDQEGATDSCFASVTVIDNTAPVPDLETLPTVTGQCSAEITTYPTATDNCAGAITGTTTDPLTYTEQGTYTVTWIFDDGRGNTAVQEQTVIVQDTTAPTIANLSANPNTLWPPNHKMVSVTVSVEAADNCDASPVSKIISVTSNEPVNGNGDGNTSPDWEITGDLTLNLRAERSGKGNGRIYAITVECSDTVGNTTTGTVTVVVPKSKKK